jgi:hypothetical protein
MTVNRYRDSHETSKSDVTNQCAEGERNSEGVILSHSLILLLQIT